MTVAFELARARVEQGLSREEVAERTGLSVDWLTSIEEVNVDRLPDMLYLRQCVSVFASAVGLDPDTVSRRYMAQLKHGSALDEFASEQGDELDAIRATTEPAVAVRVVDAPDEFPTEDSPAMGESGHPGRLEARPAREARERALLLWVMSAKPAWLTYGTLSVVTLFNVMAAVWFLVAPQRPAGNVALNGPGPQQATPSNVSQPAEQAKANPQLDSRQTGELTGSWMLTSNVEQSNNDQFKNLTLGFRLQLAHTGNRVRGRGFKWIENGRRVASHARTPITVDGTIKDGRLVLAFTERGTRRTSRGTLNLQRADDGSLHGRFSTDAARSSGRAKVVRLTS